MAKGSLSIGGKKKKAGNDSFQLDTAWSEANNSAFTPLAALLSSTDFEGRRPPWSAFKMETAFWRILRDICQAEDMSYDNFVSDAVRFKIIQHLRLRTTISARLRPADVSLEVSSTHAALQILVVDDVDISRDIASSFLRAAGHEVVCVDSGGKAVVEAATKIFEVILMDVRMPEMDGLEATRRIRALEDPRGNVPIVAVTACTFPSQLKECYEAGMTDYLSKPFNQSALVAAVARAAGTCPAGN